MRPQNWLYTIPLRIRSLFHRTQVDGELDEELQGHLERKTGEYAARGFSPNEARHAALREFRGIAQAKENCRDARKVNWILDFFHDLRYGLRSLRKSPAFTAVAVLTLALGIGANTAVFSMVDSFLLRPLPVSNPDQLAVLSSEQGESSVPNFSVLDTEDIRNQTKDVFSDVFGYQPSMEGLAVNGKAQPILMNFVSGNFFSALGIKPLLGRFIMSPEGNVQGVDPVLVLGYSYWKSRFAGDPDIVGKKVAVNGTAVTIIGVAPKGFHGVYCLVDAQGYLPLGMLTVEDWWGTHDFTSKRAVRNTNTLARLKPGVSIEQAQAALNVVATRLSREYPVDDKALSISAYPERFSRPGPDPSRKILKIAVLFMLLAGLVLALTCVNVANILLVRATVRRREMSVRAALGARRGRLIRQLLTETLALSLLGGIGGILAGFWGGQALSSINLQADLPIALDFPFDWRVFLYAFAAALITGLLAGAVPALRASDRNNLAGALRETGRTVAVGRHRFRDALVAAEIGGSLMLLIIAGLFVRSLNNAQRADFGFDPHNLINLTIDPHEVGYSSARGLQFDRQLLERVRALPGVESATLAQIVPMGYVGSNDFLEIPGYQAAPGEPQPLGWDNIVSTGYFRTMKIPLIEGRDFAEADSEHSQPVAIINQAMAARFWPNQDPIGKEFTYGSSAPATVRIVGVAKDSHFRAMSGPIAPNFYAPMAQAYLSLVTLQVRSPVAAPTMLREMQDAVASLDPGMPMFSGQTMMQALDTVRGLLVFQFGAFLAAALGILGLILAMVGVYGVISSATGQRAHEIGIRVALGARPFDILKMMFRQISVLVLMGISAGLLAAAVVARTVGNYLVGVSAMDPITYVAASLFLACIAFAACYVPTRRAMLADPMIALRHE